MSRMIRSSIRRDGTESFVVGLTKKELEAITRSWVDLNLIAEVPDHIAVNLRLLEPYLFDGRLPLLGIVRAFDANCAALGRPITLLKRVGNGKTVPTAFAIEGERGARWEAGPGREGQEKRAAYAASVVDEALAAAALDRSALLYSVMFRPDHLTALQAAGLADTRKLLEDMQQRIDELTAQYAAALSRIVTLESIYDPPRRHDENAGNVVPLRQKLI